MPHVVDSNGSRSETLCGVRVRCRTDGTAGVQLNESTTQISESIMQTTNALRADDLSRPVSSAVLVPQSHSSETSGVSWGSIFAGAAAAAALSLILLMLGVGLGLSSVSPWTLDGASAATLGVSSIVWITFTQLAASGMGGYLAGRLRTKWTSVHTDEVYFRDTAHGFLAWAVATLVTAVTLASVVGSIVSGGARAGASIATATVGADVSKPDPRIGPSSYFIDSLFRKGPASASNTASIPSSTAPPGVGTVSEVTQIFGNGIRTGSALPGEDVRYVGQLVSERTGLTQADAEKRVTDTYLRLQTTLRDAETAAKAAADSTRKSFAYAALWLFISLLSGAFVASLAATYGGRRRDI